MIPGGTDFVIEGPTSADDWWVLMFEIRQRWPRAVFHRTDPGELFVYRDQDEFRCGLRCEDTPSGLIHVFMGPENLILAVSDEPSEAAEVGRQLFTMFQELRG